MRLVYKFLESCDAIVLGSPVYFDTVSAQVKLMIDRSNCLMPYVKRPDGTWGFETRLKKLSQVKTRNSTQFRPLQKGSRARANIELAETILYSENSNELGSVKKDKQRMTEAFNVGVRLTGHV